MCVLFLGLDCENEGNLYFDDKCFFMTETKAQRFSDAKNLCTQKEGSQLVSITSAELYHVSCCDIKLKSSFISLHTI